MILLYQIASFIFGGDLFMYEMLTIIITLNLGVRADAGTCSIRPSEVPKWPSV